MLDPGQVRFVLVQPRSGGNVGAAARALKNLGFSRLVAVDPRCDTQGEEAARLAVDAEDVLRGMRVHDDLDAALARARTVVGTTRRTGKHRRPHWRLDRFRGELAALARAGELAIVFGREDHGLSDTELDRCTHLVHLPAAGDYPSFNLAQAVLLVAYELRLCGLEAPADEPLEAPAPHVEREAMYRHLEQALATIGFLSRDTSVVMMRRLRRALGRAGMSSEEVKILRGVARQILWAAGQAGLSVPDTDASTGRDEPA